LHPTITTRQDRGCEEESGEGPEGQACGGARGACGRDARRTGTRAGSERGRAGREAWSGKRAMRAGRGQSSTATTTLFSTISLMSPGGWSR
jgi:hypothetical protein